jgi:hypothetical protein
MQPKRVRLPERIVLAEFCYLPEGGRKMARPPAWDFVRCASIAVLCFLLVPAAIAWPGPAGVPALAQEPIVAVGDVHNDFDDFVAILGRAGLIDKQNHWAGGRSTFVQLGDLLDRGPKPRDVMDLMMALEKEAPQASGRVVSLLGNHEMMNIMGDLRYVIPVNYASFADASSSERQKAAYGEYVEWRTSHASLLAELAQPLELTETEWMARHPLGFVEQRQAFDPKGKYGEWLRGHSAVAEVEGVMFVHGGIHPSLSSTKLEAINDRIHSEILKFDSLKQYFQNEKIILPFFNFQEIIAVLQAEASAELKSRVSPSKEREAKIKEFLSLADWLSVRVDGPLWFRGYDVWSEQEGAPQISEILEAYKATHIVVGHTVQKAGRIRPRFGNRVFLIDTGMLSSYYAGGRPSALAVCGGSKFVALYLDGQVVLPGSPGAAASDNTAVSTADKICSATETPHQ